MIHKRSKKLAFGALALSLVLAFQTIPPTQTTNASDHIDSPIITQDRGSDLADTFAFLDPNDNSKVVLIMSTQGFVVSGEHFGMAIFDHNIRYRFEIENTGDAKPDQFIDVLYSPGLGRVTPQTATIELPNGKKFTAQTTVSDQEYKAPLLAFARPYHILARIGFPFVGLFQRKFARDSGRAMLKAVCR